MSLAALKDAHLTGIHLCLPGFGPDAPGVGRLRAVYARDPDGNILELQSWSQVPPIGPVGVG
jgi:hypothetical protein